MIRYLIIILLIVIVSCKKGDKDSSPAPHVNTFTAKVNGKPFVAKEILSHVNDFSGNGQKFFTVSATNDSSQRISISLNGYTALPMTTIIDSVAQSPAFGFYYEGRGGLYYSIQSRSGNFSITSVDKTTYRNGTVVNGNFVFEITEGFTYKIPYSITEGKFSVFVED